MRNGASVARELKKLGHDTRLMPPTWGKAYVKRGKIDVADAAAICEAVTRPLMRLPIKNVEQQSVLMLHRSAISRSASGHS